MLVKLQTHQYLIYAELNKTERVAHLALNNRIGDPPRDRGAGIMKSRGAWRTMAIPILLGFRVRVRVFSYPRWTGITKEIVEAFRETQDRKSLTRVGVYRC